MFDTFKKFYPYCVSGKKKIKKVDNALSLILQSK
jgi:hypothetical protein